MPPKAQFAIKNLVFWFEWVMARHGTALRETETCRAASRSIITKVVGLIIDSISLL